MCKASLKVPHKYKLFSKTRYYCNNRHEQIMSIYSRPSEVQASGGWTRTASRTGPTWQRRRPAHVWASRPPLRTGTTRSRCPPRSCHLVQFRLRPIARAPPGRAPGARVRWVATVPPRRLTCPNLRRSAPEAERAQSPYDRERERRPFDREDVFPVCANSRVRKFNVSKFNVRKFNVRKFTVRKEEIAHINYTCS